MSLGPRPVFSRVFRTDPKPLTDAERIELLTKIKAAPPQPILQGDPLEDRVAKLTEALEEVRVYCNLFRISPHMRCATICEIVDDALGIVP